MDKGAKKRIRVAIYARTSSEEKKASEKTSIEDQIETCQEFASSQGMVVVFVEKDRDFSGRTYWPGCPFEPLDDATKQYLDAHNVRPSKRTRPGFGTLLGRLGEIDRILVFDCKRLARPVNDSMLRQAIYQAILRQEVQVHSVKEGLIDRKDLARVLTEAVSDITSDGEINTRIEQSKIRLRSLRNDGMLYHCPSCYGFRSGGEQKAVPIESELKVVRRIFDLYLKETPVLTICKMLNADGVRTMKNKDWSYSQVRAILERLAYTGHQKSSDGREIPSKVLHPPEELIVTLDEWHSVQKTLGWKNDSSASKKDRRRSLSSDRRHPLSGLIFCGYCGYAMGTFRGVDYDNRSKTHYYRCRHSLGMAPKQAGNCRFSLIREILENSTFGCGIYDSLKLFAVHGAHRYLKQQKELPGLQDERKSLADEATRLGKREIKAYEDSEKDVITEDQRLAVLADTRLRREQIKQRIAELDEILNHNIANVPTPERVGVMLQGDDPMDRHLIRRFLHEAIKSIHVFAYSVKIQLRSGEEFTIERIPDRNSRVMPLSFASKGEKAGSVRILFAYKSYCYPEAWKNMKPRMLISGGDIEVGVIGENPAPYARTRPRKKKTVSA